MARFNTIKINNVWLTSDGLSTGDPCQTTVDGLNRQLLTFKGTMQKALDGTPYVQIMRIYGRGETLSVTVETLAKSVYDSILVILENAALNGTTVSVRISGDTGTFSFNCLPGFPQPVEMPGTFIEQRIKQVKFNFIVQNRANILIASEAAYSLAGAAAVLKRTRTLTASAGAFSLTGNAANLVKP